MKIRRHHFWIGVGFGNLSTSLLGVVAAATLVYLGGLNPARAHPIIYDLIPPITTAPAGDLTIIGDFSFDPATTTLDAVDLVVTGGPQPGSYTQPIEGFAAAISASIPGSDMDIIIAFQNDLATAPDPVSKVTFLLPNGMAVPFTPSAGAAVPANAVPEPASLFLLSGALGLFLLAQRLRYRPKVRAGESAQE